MAASHIAELFSATPDAILSESRFLRDSTDVSAFAGLLLPNAAHQRLLRLQFYCDGWFKPLEAPPKTTEDDDPVLRDIIFNLEAAARDYIDEVGRRPHGDCVQG